MNVYILRHAIAIERGEKEYPNDDRPLTKEGIRKMKDAAQGIRKVIRRADIILSSPLVRAHDTAKITAKALKYKHKILLRKELLPGASSSDILTYMKKFKESSRVLIVGHEPLLGNVASTLLGSTALVLELKKGGMCCISVSNLSAGSPGKLIWHLSPRQLRLVASA